MTTERWITLDIVKAMTIPAMIIVHNTMWWLSYHPWEIETALSSWFLGVRPIAFLVMLIPVTAGAALFFYLRQHRTDSMPQFQQILTRAIFLCSIGFIMNMIAFGFASTLQWNVLQFYSVSMLVVYCFLRFANEYWLFLFGLISLICAPILRTIFGSYSDIYLVAITIGEPSSEHFWPFFPWFSIVVLGYIIARILSSQTDTTVIHLRKKSASLFLIGSFLVTLSVMFDSFFYKVDFNNLWGELIFQPPTLQILGTIGVALLLFSVTHLFFHKLSVSPYGLIRTFSIGFFYIYVAHMIVGHQLQTAIKNNPDINFLWLLIVVQLLLAYLVGVLVVRWYHKMRMRRG